MTFDELPVLRSRLYRFLCRKSGNAELAEDLCQTVLLKTWQRSQALGVMPSFGYVIKSGLNALYSARRRRQPHQLGDGFDQAGREVDPANAIGRSDRARIVSAFDRLPPRYREVARLRFLLEWRETRIANRLNLPLGTVKTRVARAKRILEERLRSYWIG